MYQGSGIAVLQPCPHQGERASTGEAVSLRMWRADQAPQVRINGLLLQDSHTKAVCVMAYRAEDRSAHRGPAVPSAAASHRPPRGPRQPKQSPIEPVGVRVTRRTHVLPPRRARQADLERRCLNSIGRVSHSTGDRPGPCISTPKISAVFPDTPLCDWPLSLLEFYFHTLEACVMSEGTEQ